MARLFGAARHARRNGRRRLRGVAAVALRVVGRCGKGACDEPEEDDDDAGQAEDEGGATGYHGGRAGGRAGYVVNRAGRSLVPDSRAEDERESRSVRKRRCRLRQQTRGD